MRRLLPETAQSHKPVQTLGVIHQQGLPTRFIGHDLRNRIHKRRIIWNMGVMGMRPVTAPDTAIGMMAPQLLRQKHPRV